MNILSGSIRTGSNGNSIFFLQLTHLQQEQSSLIGADRIGKNLYRDIILIKHKNEEKIIFKVRKKNVVSVY